MVCMGPEAMAFLHSADHLALSGLATAAKAGQQANREPGVAAGAAFAPAAEVACRLCVHHQPHGSDG